MFPDLRGQVVERIMFDYSATLVLSSAAEVRIEQAFLLEDADKPVGLGPISPEAPEGSGRVLGVLHQQVVAAEVDGLGQLRMRFGNGLVLTCAPSEAFEAWSLTLVDGELFVCQPGGGIAHWAATA